MSTALRVLDVVGVPLGGGTDAQALVDRGAGVLGHQHVGLAHGVHEPRPGPGFGVHLGQVVQSLLALEAQPGGLDQLSGI